MITAKAHWVLKEIKDLFEKKDSETVLTINNIKKIIDEYFESYEQGLND